MRKQLAILLAAMLCLSLLGLSSVAGAFTDLHNDPYAEQIQALKRAGIIKGEANGHFNPRGKLTYAAGITAIVNAFDLNLDHIRFIKTPKASDYFKHVPNRAWYAQAFIIAHHHGIELPKQVQPNKQMTKEEFAHYLFQAIQATGEYYFTEQYIIIDDQKRINKAYSDSIQKLLVSDIISLDKNRKFHPNQAITRSEAFSWLYKALKFVNKLQDPDWPVEPGKPYPHMQLDVQRVNKQVNQVTVSAQAPHPGYGLRITAIDFVKDEAIIYTEAILPDPDKFYIQVITDVQDTTYIASKYKPVLADQKQARPDWPTRSSKH